MRNLVRNPHYELSSSDFGLTPPWGLLILAELFVPRPANMKSFGSGLHGVVFFRPF
jgi:hypothetical protein